MHVELLKQNAFCLKKRILDYVLGCVMFILFLPVMLLIALIILFISPNGSPFFIQEREGLGGRKIKVIKFRTMHIDSEKRLKLFLKNNPDQVKEWYKYYNLDSKIDPRLITFGGFLRKSSLDELPNLWNVIKGDLSLVGPRPFPYYHLESYDKEFRALRASVWPGVTGLWQIKRGDIETQKRLDIEYVQNWSFKTDVKILMQTIPVLLLSSKAHY